VSDRQDAHSTKFATLFKSHCLAIGSWFAWISPTTLHPVYKVCTGSGMLLDDTPQLQNVDRTVNFNTQLTVW
jgi:hypothetical protein